MSDEDDIKEVDAEFENEEEKPEDNYPIIQNQGQNAVTSYEPIKIENYGTVVRRSTICPICLRNDCMKINLARARDHKKFTIIAAEFGTSIENLRIHFRGHFILQESQQTIIDYKEDDSTEAKEIVTKIFDRNTDIVDGAQSVLQSKAERLTELNAIRHELADRREINALEDVEKQEYVQYHKLINDLENSILQTYVVLDKKIWGKDLGNAVTSYKMSILQKLVDQVILVFLEFEKKSPEYKEMISEMRVELSKRINEMEDIISKSGGLITPLGGE
jgi:hypothetical protein